VGVRESGEFETGNRSILKFEIYAITIYVIIFTDGKFLRFLFFLLGVSQRAKLQH
jgi:hypothetical protein